MKFFHLSALLPIFTVVIRSRADGVETRIVGGSDIQQGSFPYFVSLVDSSDVHRCGGSLIAPNLVLTSASCLSSSESDLTAALVGFYSPNDTSFEKIAIVDTFISEDFDSTTREFDVMVVQLAFASTKPWVRINEDPEFPATTPARLLTAIGFGTVSTDQLTPPSVVQEIEQLYISNPSCFALMSVSDAPREEKFISPDKICITDYSVSDGQCVGDLGGPIVSVGGEDSSADSVIGILSSFSGCSVTRYPTVGTRTSSAFPFIRSTVCSTSGSPPAYFGCTVVVETTSPTLPLPTPPPTSSPTVEMTAPPSNTPTQPPTKRPSLPPSSAPSLKPSLSPTASPSVETTTPNVLVGTVPPAIGEPGTTPGGLECVANGSACSNALECCSARCQLGKCWARMSTPGRARNTLRGGMAGELLFTGQNLPIDDRINFGS